MKRGYAQCGNRDYPAEPCLTWASLRLGPGDLSDGLSKPVSQRHGRRPEEPLQGVMALGPRSGLDGSWVRVSHVRLQSLVALLAGSPKTEENGVVQIKGPVFNPRHLLMPSCSILASCNPSQGCHLATSSWLEKPLRSCKF